MKFIIIGKNIDVTAGLKEAVENKLGKLERYFTPDTEVHVTLSVQRERQKIEVTIPVKGGIIRSEEECNDMYVSIDLVEEIIERQLRKYKTKLIAKHQEGGNFKQEFFDKDEPSEDDGEIKIVRTKKFGFKPMYPEDACVQMELLGHDVFVFRNAETDEVNVLDQIKRLIRIKNEETHARRDSRLVFFTQFLLPLQDHRLPVNHRKNTFLFLLQFCRAAGSFCDFLLQYLYLFVRNQNA